MQKLQNTDLFSIGWLVLGIIHASFFLLGFNGYYHFLGVFGLASLVIFPLRYWLIEKVLGMKLEGWAWWTGIGTGLAFAVATGFLWISQIWLFICCYSPSDNNFFENFLLFGFHPVFRFTLLWFQEWKIPKFKNGSWLIENSFGVILVWLALGFVNPQGPAFGAFLAIVAVAISELITAHSLITIKSHVYEDAKEKRKVEEL